MSSSHLRSSGQAQLDALEQDLYNDMFVDDDEIANAHRYRRRQRRHDPNHNNPNGEESPLGSDEEEGSLFDEDEDEVDDDLPSEKKHGGDESSYYAPSRDLPAAAASSAPPVAAAPAAASGSHPSTTAFPSNDSFQRRNRGMAMALSHHDDPEVKEDREKGVTYQPLLSSFSPLLSSNQGASESNARSSTVAEPARLPSSGTATLTPAAPSAAPAAGMAPTPSRGLQWNEVTETSDPAPRTPPRAAVIVTDSASKRKVLHRSALEESPSFARVAARVGAQGRLLRDAPHHSIHKDAAMKNGEGEESRVQQSSYSPHLARETHNGNSSGSVTEVPPHPHHPSYVLLLNVRRLTDRLRSYSVELLALSTALNAGHGTSALRQEQSNMALWSQEVHKLAEQQAVDGQWYWQMGLWLLALSAVCFAAALSRAI